MKNEYPLRKIVAILVEQGSHNGMPIERRYELLECGHQSKNLTSSSHAIYKRRCKLCGKKNEPIK